ncbi:MAG TPA: APC family permease [Candidatus Sulfotelmatobacter sp.]|nr:APC family permease [Candidatus Sulfotelmatobacter sp.]
MRPIWYKRAMPRTEQMNATSEGLVRVIGRWSLVALTVNSILGSGIFGLPSQIADKIGRNSPWAVLLAGGLMGVIIACYGEVASQFSDTGGTYIYCRTAFGQLTGLQVGWMMMLSRLTACAANANLLVIYLGTFWPVTARPGMRFTIITILLGILLLVNYRGVRGGTLVSNLFVIAKMVPLTIVCLVGAYFLSMHAPASWPATRASTSNWRDALLLLFFAYGGYEAAMNPLGEARNPKRDAPFALFMALAIIAFIYTVIQWVVVGVLPSSAHTDRPLAEVARLIMGEPGSVLVALGAVISVYGYLSANFLTGPRMTFALAEQGDFPRLFAAVHPGFKTPHVSIVFFAVLCWGLALAGSFTWNVTLSAVARLVYYGAVCAAVPVLRRKQPDAAWLRVPAGNVLAPVGILICVALLSGVDFSKTVILLFTIALAFVNWLAVRK